METHEQMPEAGLARRKFLKHAAVAAWASPVIVTMLSRSAQAQVVCGTTATGVVCTNTTTCSPPNTLCAPQTPGQAGNCTCQEPPP